MLKDINSGYTGSPEKWKEFLCLWEKKRDELNLDSDSNDHFVWNKNINPSEIQEKILRIEDKLALTLPKSYKDFIMAIDGSYIPSWLLNGTFSDFLLPITEVDWLKNLFPELVYEYYPADPDIIIEDEEYYQYNKNQDDYAYRREYLQHCLKLNKVLEDGEYEILLNQKEQTRDGEFEAWFFYTGEGSVLRYTSFAALIIGLYLLDVTQIDTVCILSNKDDPYGFSNLLFGKD